MPFFTKTLYYSLEPDEVRNITDDVIKVVKESKVTNGFCNVFAKGSTSAVIISEYEKGHIKDLFKALELIAPSAIYYEHHKAWNDDNGKSHVRACFLQHHLTMPIINNVLCISTWQNILLINLDTRTRNREVIISILY
jgi:secondary thiamine-phosphate synthase enzyme